MAIIAMNRPKRKESNGWQMVGFDVGSRMVLEAKQYGD
jgi:hypothetical protein